MVNLSSIFVNLFNFSLASAIVIIFNIEKNHWTNTFREYIRKV